MGTTIHYTYEFYGEKPQLENILQQVREQFQQMELTRIGLLGAIYSLTILIPAIAVSVRRLHDTGRSGWMLLVNLIPLIGCFIVLFFLVQDSTPGENEYGSSPRVNHARRGERL